MYLQFLLLLQVTEDGGCVATPTFGKMGGEPAVVVGMSGGVRGVVKGWGLSGRLTPLDLRGDRE